MEAEVFQTNPRLRGLLLILIFTFAASGIALAVFAQIQSYHRDQLYYATEAALPVHRVNQKNENSDFESPSTSLGTIGDIANWMTYRNIEYGFEIGYLSSCKVLEQKEYSAVAFQCDQREFAPYSPRVIFFKGSHEVPPENTISKKNVVIDRMNGLDTIVQGNGKFFQRYLYYGDSTYLVGIVLSNEDSFDINPELDPETYLLDKEKRILSSFKIIQN